MMETPDAPPQTTDALWPIKEALAARAAARASIVELIERMRLHVDALESVPRELRGEFERRLTVLRAAEARVEALAKR